MIDRALERYARDEAFADLVAGLGSTAARFDRLLARFAPARESGGDGEGVEAPEDLMALVLGMIAIRTRLAAAIDASAAEAAPAAPRARSTESLLR